VFQGLQILEVSEVVQEFRSNPELECHPERERSIEIRYEARSLE